MKLKVLGFDGQSVETLNIVGTCEFSEPREENGVPVGQGCIYCKELGARYFFAADGRYDGPEWECSFSIPESDMPDDGSMPSVVNEFLNKMQSERDIEPLAGAA